MGKGKSYFVAGILGDLLQENLDALSVGSKIVAIIFSVYFLTVGGLGYAILAALGWTLHIFVGFLGLTLRDSYGQTDIGKLFMGCASRSDKVKLLEKELAELKTKTEWAHQKVASKGIAGVIG